MTSARPIAGLLALIACTSCTATPTEPMELRVLSYNIKRGLGNDGKTDIGRAAALIRRVEADLVVLQEIDKGVRRSGRVDQMRALAELTGLHAEFGPFMPYQGGEYGIGLMSRYPILKAANRALPRGAEPRTALEARVQLPGGDELLLCSVHLYRTEKERLAQAKTLVDLYRDTRIPMIVGGDFNSRPGSSVMELVESHWVNTDKGEDRLTMSATNPRSEIDYILYRPAKRFEVVSIDVLHEPVVSDHRPVLMVLRLLPTSDP